MFDEVITTLYEGHYHYGVAALINSLTKASFKGLVCIGYRGSLPEWINQIEKNTRYYKLNDRINIEFIFLETSMHFGYYKPYFVRDCLDKYKAERIFYFDPDIVINTPWLFFSEWVDCGIALCMDISYTFMHNNHPWRRQWIKLSGLPTHQTNNVNFFVNSGFIGLHRRDVQVIQTWIELTEKYKKAGKNISSFEQSIAYSAFKSDQDLLNAAITVMPATPLSVIGTEGMGFTHPAFLMSHAIGDGIKPWKRNFIKAVITKGNKPSIAETDYLKYCNHPIKTYKSHTLYLKKTNFNFAKLIGRLWHN